MGLYGIIMYGLFIMGEEIDVEDIPYIPFFGGEGVPSNTSPEDVANWVRPNDKIPLLLTLSLYAKPHENFMGWNLVKDSYKIRYAAWFNEQTGEIVIGLKGTSGKSGTLDLLDDAVRRVSDIPTYHRYR